MTTNTNSASVTQAQATQVEGQAVEQGITIDAAEGAAASGATGEAASADGVCFNIAEDGTVIISKPAADVSQALEANAAQKYIFNVSSDEIKSAVAEGDDLVLTFDNGSTVRLEKYMTEIASGEDATLNFMNGQTVTLASLFPADVEPAAGEEEPAEAELRDPQPLLEERAENTQAAEQVAAVEPAAGEEVAEQLAAIEPAAGEAGAGAAGGNSGFGFNSSFRAQGVISLDDVGPIDPTALEYGIQRPNDDLLFIEEEPADLNPALETGDSQVLEDGSVALQIEAAPESVDGVMVITITGIPNTWTVTGPGTYDPVTETWTITTTPGAPFSGGPTLAPPADSDVDLPGLVVTVTETDIVTGQTGTSTSTIDVIVDAVADTPEVDGLDDSGLEGTALDIEIPTALTGEEVNAGGIGLDDGSETITNIIIYSVDTSVDLNDYIITNVNGPVTLDANGNIVLTDRSELQNLQITPKDPNFVGSIELQIVLNTQENPGDDEFNNTNDVNQATDKITLTWIPVANPPEVEVDPREVNPNGDIENGYVLEDNSVIMDVSGTLDPNGSGDEILSLTVTGIDLTKLEGGEAGFTASNGPNGEVWTRVPGSPDTAASYTITLSTPDTNYTGSFTFTPAEDSDLDITGMSVTASSYEPASNTTATSAPDEFDVIVDAVADPVDITAVDDTGREGDALDIVVNNVLTGEEINAGGIGQDDGSESIVNIVISAVDPSVDLNDFTFTNANGPVTVNANGSIILSDRADLQGLQITPKDPNFVGSIELNVTLNTRDNANDADFNDTNDTATDTDTLKLTWKPTANPPEVEVDTHNPNGNIDDALVLEDNSVSVSVNGTLDPNGSGDEILSLTVTGIDLTKLEGGEAGFTASNGPNGEVWTRVPGSPDTAASYTITLTTPGANYTGTFGFTPVADGDMDITGMSVTASAYEPATDTTATSAPDAFNVIVDAVADDVEITAMDDSGAEGTSLDIVVNNVLTGEESNAGGIGQDDGSESIVNIVISAVNPLVDLNDFTFTNANGPVTLDANGNIVFTDRADLQGLKITPKDPNFVGSIELNVTLNTAETQLNGVDFDDTNNTATDTDTLKLTWKPTANPPEVEVDTHNPNGNIDDALVKEDSSVSVDVSGTLDPNGSGNEVLSLTVTGIDLTKLDDFSASNGPNGEVWTRVPGSPDTAASYTITLTTPGTNYTGTFTFTPEAQSDVDITGMAVTASAYEPATDTTATSAPDSFNVIVDAVADKPSVTADDNSGEEGAALAVNIDGLLGVDNFDGSESITGYEVHGDQAEMINFTFTVNGTERVPVNGVITLSPAEVDALVVTPKDSTWTGSLDLEAVVLNAESPDDNEYDTSDNTNSASDPFTLTWVDDDEPIITQPEKVVVDETNLAGNPRSTSVSDKIDVDFGDDSAGATIKGNNTFNIGGATSNGNAIAVNYNAATGTYTGSAVGKTVFTLVIDNDGDYTFTLLDTIDHPVLGNDNNTAGYNDGLNFSFGFTATDSDNDSADGTITVTVLDDGLSARDDIASVSEKDGSASGNVITGEGNINTDGADDLSQDGPNTITMVNGIPVSETGTTTIAGQYGTLEIAADGSYTYTLTPGATEGSAIDFNETLDFPEVREGQAISGNTLNNLGIADGALTTNTAVHGSVSFVAEGASYNNSFGYYTVAADGTLQAASILVENGHDVSTGTFGNFSVNAGETLGFFIVADGFDFNNAYSGVDLSNGSLSFVYKAGTAEERPANIADNGKDVSLIFTHGTTGAETMINGAIYHTTERGDTNNLNADSSVRVVSGLADGQSDTLRIGFEDLPKLGDKDYEDFVFDLKLYPQDVQDEFTYTLTDGDGDTSQATLTFDVEPNSTPADIKTVKLTVDETDIDGQAPVGSDSDSGQVIADFGFDGPGTFHTGDASNITFTGAKGGELTSNGVPVVITVEGNSYVGKAGGTTVFELEINSNGQYTFTLTGQLDHANASNPNDTIGLNFEVVARDTDGETVTGNIQVDVRDDGPKANHDFNSFDVVSTTKDYNVVFILDVSGSMAGNKLALLKSSVSNLLNDFNDYQGGEVKVHIVPFSTNTHGGQTFTVTNDADLTKALNFVNGMTAANSTNFEAPMQSAISWLEGNTSNDPIQGADTFTYFVSDGDPNRYIGPNGQVAGRDNDATTPMNEILGNTASDKVSEVEALKALNKEVISIGIGVNGTTLGRLDMIDSNGNALDVKDPNDLDAAFQSTNPVMGSASGNVITGAGNTNTGGADELSEDGPNTVTAVNGVNVSANGVTTVNGTFGTLEIAANGSYTYKLNPNLYQGGDIVERFNYTLRDADGDTSVAVLTINGNGNDVPSNIVTEKLWIDETDVLGQDPVGTDSATGTATANFGADGPGTFQVGNPSNFTFSGGKDGALTSNGVPVQITVEGNSYVGKANGTTVFELEIDSNGEYTFTLHEQLDHGNTRDANDGVDMYFEIKAVDADGDSTSGQVRVYVQDDAPVAKQDVNNFTYKVVEKDYNVVLVLDVSGSMEGNKLSLLKSSVANLLSEYNSYQNGDIKVHIVPFATSAQQGATFTVTSNADFNNALNYLNGLRADGFTNYEAPLQSAIGWLQGQSNNDPIAGADTYTYFVSDGEPNRHINPSGTVVTGSASDTMKEITGTSATDKVSEVALLQSLSKEVIGVGIGVNSTTLGRLNTIDSDGKALDVKKAEDLDAAFQSTNPIRGGETSGNVITGAGNDNANGADGLSFDGPNYVTSVNGEPIARDGKTIIDGTYGKLEIAADGSYTYTLDANTNSNVQERFNYTLTDADADSSTSTLNINATMGGYTTDAASSARLFSVDSYDSVIALSDYTSAKGTAGKDSFVFGADSHDNSIDDYNAAEGDVLDISSILTGYDELTDMLEDFVFVNKAANDTQVFVDASGSGDITAATLLVTLEGVDVTLADLNINTESKVV